MYFAKSKYLYFNIISLEINSGIKSQVLRFRTMNE